MSEAHNGRGRSDQGEVGWVDKGHGLAAMRRDRLRFV